MEILTDNQIIRKTINDFFSKEANEILILPGSVNNKYRNIVIIYKNVSHVYLHVDFLCLNNADDTVTQHRIDELYVRSILRWPHASSQFIFFSFYYVYTCPSKTRMKNLLESLHNNAEEREFYVIVTRYTASLFSLEFSFPH